MATLGDYQDRAAKALAAQEAQYARQIADIWRGVLDDIRIQMSKLYEKYAVDGVLTKAEMTRYNRLATAEAQILETVSPAIKSTLKQIDRLRPDQYDAAFFRTAWAIDQASGLRLTYGTLNKDSILKALANTFYDSAKWRYDTTGKTGAINAISNGLARGKSYTKMIADLKDYINVQNWQAMRILRTEGQTAVNAGTDAAYLRAADQGVTFDVIWVATLDGRTRDDHGSADGQVRGSDGMFTIGGEKTPYPLWEGLSAGERINCRCTTRAEIAGYAPQLRRTRDEGLIPYQTYEQWRG